MSMSRQIIEECLKGTKPADVAALLGCTRDHVYGALYRARKRGESVPKFDSGPTSGKLSASTRISRRTRGLLQKQAMRLGVNPFMLAEDILSKVLASDKVTEVFYQRRKDNE